MFRAANQNESQDHMNSNGISIHLNGKSVSSLSCPACGTLIAPEQYERILRIDEARENKLAGERIAIEKARDAIEKDREAIATKAIAEESAKWDVDRVRIAKEIERLQNQAEVEHDRLARTHEKEMQAEQRRNEAQEKKLAQQITTAKAKADAEAAARAKEAKRAAEADQREIVEELKGQVKTAEARRRRDEENFKKVVVDLRRKTEARDREHFGIDGEEELIAVLRADFAGDRIEHHGKGGDVLQFVMDGGKEAGVIVHEVKNRNTWSADFVSQTQRAMETHNTKYGVLVSRVLPARKSGMCVMRGVIVVAPFVAAQVVHILRDGIIALHRMNLSETDRSDKMSALFSYLRGEEFGTAIQRVITKIAELRDSLGRERSSHDSSWRLREQHYAAILRDATGIDARVRDLFATPVSTVRTKMLAFK